MNFQLSRSACLFVAVCSVGLSVAGAFAAEKEAPVALPKFEVNDSRPAYLVNIPGFEILSFVDPTETAEFANRLRWQTGFIPRFFPEGRRALPPVPATIILESRLGAEVKAARIDAQEWGEVRKFPGFEREIRAWQPDEDTFSLFAELAPSTSLLGLKFDGRIFSVASRHWPELDATYRWLAERSMLHVPRWYRDEVASWLSALKEVTSSRATFGDRWFNPGVFPPKDIFSRLEASDPHRTFPRDHVAKFVQWGLSGGPDRGRALMDFIDETTKGPVTEEMFQRHFGLDYATAQKAFASAPRSFGSLVLTRPDGNREPTLTTSHVKVASRSDVARIMGAAYVAEGAPFRGGSPQPGLLLRGSKLLHRAYDDGDRDSRLLAALGFLELALNDRDRAKLYFEQAAAAGIFRPRVYLELSRIRFAEALAKSALLDETTVAFVLEPLKIAQTQLPEMQSIYALLVEIEWHRNASPPAIELSVLGKRVWPASDTLPTVWKTALLLAKNARENEAIQLLEHAVRETTIRAGSAVVSVTLPDSSATPWIYGTGVGIAVGPTTLLANNDLAMWSTGQHVPPRLPSVPREQEKLLELLQSLRAKDGSWKQFRSGSSTGYRSLLFRVRRETPGDPIFLFARKPTKGGALRCGPRSIRRCTGKFD